jgi:hypothetical protein
MPVAPTTKLESVNYLLSIVGEAPVTALNTDENASASVALATNLINEVDRMVQSRGWGFNTASLFTFNKSGSQFPVSSDTLRVNVLATLPATNLIQRFVLRNGKLYDSTYGIFDNPVIPGTATQYTALLGERVFLVDFDELPQAARQYIVIRAGRMFLQRVLPDDASNKISEIDEQMAFAMLIEWEIKSGRSADYAKFSTELESLGINFAVFSNASVDDKAKLVKLSAESLGERQQREYYEERIKDKTTAASDTYATYRVNFNRLGITEKDFIGLDPILREELLVIAKNTTTTADTRASLFFTSTNASKASKLGIRYSDFLKFTREEQQLFLDGVASLSEDRFSRFVTNKSKAEKLGVRINDFLSYKPEEQELFLDTLASGSYTDTRAANYVTHKAVFDRLGIKATDFFALKAEEQSNVLEAVTSVGFTDTRVSSYLLNQENIRRYGLTFAEFMALPWDQQTLILEAVSSAIVKIGSISTGSVDIDSIVGGTGGIVVGQKIAGGGIEYGSIVTQISSTTSLKISKPATTTNATASLTFLLDVNSKTQALLTGQNLRTLIKAGINVNEFIGLTEKQQYQLIDLISGFEDSSRYQGFVVKQDQFKLRGISLKDFLGLKPSEQQNLVDSSGSLEASITTSQVASFENADIAHPHINDILMAVGLNPAQDSNRDYIHKAKYIFEQVLKDVQAMGWHYNTDIQNFSATGDVNGNFKRIPIDASILSIDTDKYGESWSIDPVIRYDQGAGPHSAGRFIWDRKNNKWVDSNLNEVEVIKNLDLRSIPSHILKYAKAKAAKELAYNLNSITNAPDISVKNAFLVQEEARSRADAIEEDSKQGDYSIFDNYSVSNILDR